SLGRLDAVSTLLPEPQLFLYSYVRKEAVLSSQIEGTQSSLSQLLLFEIDEAPGVPLDDVEEVSSYVAALEHGLERVRSGFPISNRLLREVHAVLLATGRGSDKGPGEFRRSQNWIGGTRPGNAAFVPPPPDQVEECMGDLERFVHDEIETTPILVKAALAHAQFETIHPFLDGNGRVGRLLITLLLCTHGILKQPLLYLSLFLKQHRSQYYDLLGSLRRDGNWEEWLAFFAEGVSTTAEAAVASAQALTRLFESDRELVREKLRQAAGSALRVHNALQARPVSTIRRLSQATGLSVPTISRALDRLVELDVVEEITGRKWRRTYAYREYLGVLNEGTEAGSR
ncbi:MAG: Fic family protein, partial [Thermoanaerobaculia bacterium]